MTVLEEKPTSTSAHLGAAWFKDILDALSAHIAVLDAQGRIVAVNRAWLAFAVAEGGATARCGVGVDYLTVCEAAAFNGDPLAGQVAEGLRRLLRGEADSYGVEYPCHAPGVQRWFLLQASPLPGGNGCVVAHIDITARKQAEEAQARLGAILSATSDFVGMAAPDGEVIYLNEAFHALSAGRGRGPGLGHISDYHPTWVTRRLLDEAIPQAMRQGSWAGETAVWAADGRELPVHQLILAHRDGAGRLEYMSTIMRDISDVRRREEDLRRAYDELKRAQSQLLQSEKMASVGQLAAGVAHEINNPIGFVFSNLGHLSKYADDLFAMLAAYRAAEPDLAHPQTRAQLTERRQALDVDFLLQDTPSLLRESLEGINRVRKIVQDLRDFSRSGEHDTWEWSDLRHGLERTLNIVWNELKYKAQVEREFAEIPEILCLPGQLNQVFMNLLVNAAQAIDGQGQVSVRTGTQGDRVWVEIADTGSGIPPEHLTRIFEPFFTTKPVGKGTGLGLSISYGIVKKHGGDIQVESEPGRGTRFRVELPVAGPEDAVPPNDLSSPGYP